MDRKTKIYNFGPDGRDACWAALTSSWTHCSRQPASLNSRSVNSCRTTKKKNPTVLTMASLSPRPQPLPPSSPRALKCKPSTQQRPILTNNRPSSSVKITKQTISEPPTISDQCNCSQSGYSELSGVSSVTSNNNNNDDDGDKNNQKYGVLETINAVNQNQQQIMCAADSGLSTDIKKPVTVYAEEPVKCALQNGGGDCISSISCPPISSTAVEQPIEIAQQIEADNVSSMSYTPTLSTAVEQPIEHVSQIEADVSSVSCPLTLSTAVKQPIEDVPQIEGDNISFISCSPTPSTDAEQSIDSAQQIEADNVSSVSCTSTLSTAVEQHIEHAQQIEADNVSSVSCTSTLSTAVEQHIEHVPQIEGDNVSSMSCPSTLSTAIEPPIEHVPQIEGDNVSSMSCPSTLSTAVEQPIEHVPQIEGDNVSSMSCPSTLCTAVEQPIEHVQQIEYENVSSMPCTLTMSTPVDQPIEPTLQIESDSHIISVFCPPTPSTAIEKTMTTEKSVIMEVVMGCYDEVSSVLWPQFPLMTSTTDVKNPMDVTVVSQSPQPQPKDDEECLFQSNTGMMVFSDKPLSKYEMKIKEIDNNIISYSKSFLSTVLFVVLLRVLF